MIYILVRGTAIDNVYITLLSLDRKDESKNKQAMGGTF